MPEPLQPWAKEPWFAKEHPDGSGGLIYVPHESGAIVLLAETLEGKDLARANRIVACVNACQGVPTECLERVEQGKSSVIVADEVLNGQRAHFVMPDSTKT